MPIPPAVMHQVGAKQDVALDQAPRLRRRVSKQLGVEVSSLRNWEDSLARPAKLGARHDRPDDAPPSGATRLRSPPGMGRPSGRGRR